ncbi:DUF1272 domain-containing protein [Algicella marina]|uniref:DUF1272 domain-containing protein n=1 Tax=Algicella marina TaxID=2683284 RepID=A0A6P1T256_9RHOB|nr:DUF1272 domain-containing protein [Algicella marina]QHQ35811.1 DUF1272 domain-containing protein [Algicella marina]
MLELRPNCEWCNRDLPHDATDARICTYECTYCAHCVDTVLHNVCPTCGGNFAPRPIRPKAAYQPTLTLGLINDPASATRKQSRWSAEQVAALSEQLRAVAPADR